MAGNFTNRESVKSLCKSLIVRLENQKMISFFPRLRNIIQDEMYQFLAPFILTEEDIRDRTSGTIQGSADLLNEAPGTESDRYRAARAVIMDRYKDNAVNGFYLQKPLIDLGRMVAEFLMRSSHIEDVFESDDQIQQFVVTFVREYRPENAH